MKVLLIREGEIDDLLIPPLITLIAANNGIAFPLDFRQDILTRFQKGSGFGSVESAVKRVIDALRVDRASIRKQFQKVIVMLDGKGTAAPQARIRQLIAGEPEFFLGVAIKEVEAWVLADRDHVLDWLRVQKRDCPDCRFWNPGYQPEQDPDPKETLEELIRYSDRTVFDRWSSGAATEFIEYYWKGTNFESEEVNVTNWPGRADLTRIRTSCPRGFGRFYNDLIQFL